MLRNMTAQHYTVLILILLAVSTQGQSLHSWSEVTSVGFVFGTMLSVANTLYAAFVVDRPGGRKDVWDDQKRAAFRADQAAKLGPVTIKPPAGPPAP